ncbi:hypothetical protein G9C98_002803, partial [Cotesia typhae]
YKTLARLPLFKRRRLVRLPLWLQLSVFKLATGGSIGQRLHSPRRKARGDAAECAKKRSVTIGKLRADNGDVKADVDSVFRGGEPPSSLERPKKREAGELPDQDLGRRIHRARDHPQEPVPSSRRHYQLFRRVLEKNRQEVPETLDQVPDLDKLELVDLVPGEGGV